MTKRAASLRFSGPSFGMPTTITVITPSTSGGGLSATTVTTIIPFQDPGIVAQNAIYTATGVGQWNPGNEIRTIHTTVYLDGPHGAFTPDTSPAGDRAAGGLVLIAGGSGIAPMLAILRTLADDRDQRRHRLVVSAPGRPYAGELDALAALLDLEVTWLDGRWIDPALLREVLPESGLDQYGFFVCGPDAVITGTLAALDRLDVPAAAIATERY